MICTSVQCKYYDMYKYKVRTVVYLQVIIEFLPLVASFCASGRIVVFGGMLYPVCTCISLYTLTIWLAVKTVLFIVTATDECQSHDE